MVERALVIGAGFLGDHVIHEFNNLDIRCVGTHFTSTDENMLTVDVRNIESLENCIERFKPNIIINCAANVQIDFLEKNPELAFAINAEGAKNVASICEDKSIRLIHISTDGIFDGHKGMYTEEDIPSPVNVYGQSKFLGEKFVKENNSDYVIIRTNFYGYNQDGKFLFNWILSTLKQNKELIGFDDIIFTPLEISNLASMITEIAITDYSGIIHFASDEPISKYQFAQKVAKTFRFNKDLIKKGSINDVQFIAKRPKNTSLSNKRAREIIKTPITPLADWLNSIKLKNT